MSHPTRLSLIESLQASSNDEAWELFAEIYDGVILGWLSRQGVQSNDAADIRQEVMATVLQEIANFEHSGRVGAFRSWLRRITAHRMHRLWEKKSTRQRRLSSVNLSEIADQMADDNSRMSMIWAQQHDAFVLSGLLKTVGPRFAPQSLEAFRRLAIEQESAESVAHDLGMTLGAVRVAQHRVLKALKASARELVD